MYRFGKSDSADTVDFSLPCFGNDQGNQKIAGVKIQNRIIAYDIPNIAQWHDFKRYRRKTITLLLFC